MNGGGFQRTLFDDCLDATRQTYEWQVFTAHAPFKSTTVFEAVGLPVQGSFDPVARNGVISGSGAAVRFDNYNRGARAIVLGGLGLKVSGSGAVVTGRIERTRTIFSRFGPTKPLLRLKRIGFASGPFQRKGKDVPDTFVIALSGRATVLPALARELTRIRCRGPHIVTSHPIRAGTPFGAVRVQLRPDAATGIGGTFEISSLAVTGYDASADQDVTVTVTPTPPARQAGKAIRWDLPADLRTPLRCEASYNCVPAVGAQFSLGGGFVLSLGERRTTVADLSVAAQDFNGSPGPVVTGTLDGAPITLIRGIDTTSDFDERVGAALGITDVRSIAGAISAHFAKTAAP
jgi:hypothetical protein